MTTHPRSLWCILCVLNVGKISIWRPWSFFSRNKWMAYQDDPHVSLFKQRVQKQTNQMKTLSISGVIFYVSYVFATRHFLNMRYFQTRALTTMFIAQRSVRHINSFDWVFIALGLYLVFLYKFWFGLVLHKQVPRVPHLNKP